MSDWVWRQGDLNQFVQTIVDAAGNPVNLQGVAGSAIKLTVTPIRGGTPIINAASMTNLQLGDGLSDGTRGRVGYTPQAGETTAPGDYLGSIKVTTLGLTFPNEGYILITITPTAPTSAGRYLTVEELKKTVELSGLAYADADITVAIEAASRGLEATYRTRWVLGAPGEVRYYTRSTPTEVPLGDVLSIASVGLDYGLTYSDAGPGDYSTALPPTDYRTSPVTSGLVSTGGTGEPYKHLHLVRGASAVRLPSGTDAIRITGQFGWEQTPAGVKTATTIIATRLLRRTREAPFGIIQVGIDGAAVRAAQIASDPEVRFAMKGLGATRRLLV